MKTCITFYSRGHNSEKPHRRFYKLIYTAALRLGKEISLESYKIDFVFDGEVWPDVQGHNGAIAYKGQLSINGDVFENIIVILREHHNNKHHIITFWPDTQHPDAKHSYTDILVEVAMEGRPYPPEDVVRKMHTKFIENPGVSPGALMLMIHDEDKEYFKSQISGDYENIINDMAVDLNTVTEELKKAEAKNLENFEKINKLKQEQASNSQTIEEQAAVIEHQNNEIKRLQNASMMKEKPGTVVSKSDTSAVILNVDVEHGTNWKGQETKTICLTMSDGTKRKNNWSNGFNERLELANLLKLKGTPVITDVWNSPDKPDLYKAKDWFKNIYVAE